MAYLIGSASTARFSSTYAINSGAGANGLYLVGNPADTAAVATGTATGLSLYISSWGSQTNIKAVLYDESSAGALLESVLITSSVGTGVVRVDLAGTTTITSGNNYRLGLYTEDGDPITMFSDTGGLTLRRFTSGTYTTPADPSNQSGGYDSFNEFYFAIDDDVVGASIIPADATPNDGDSIEITCADMTGPITAATIAGKDMLADLSGTDPSVPITFTVDVAALAASATDGDFPRIGQTSTISFTTATDGAVTTDITIQPKTGWAVVDLAATLVKGVDDLLTLIDAKHSITTAVGNQLYYSQAYGEAITAQGVYSGGTLLPYQFTEYVIQQDGSETTVAASYGERFYPFGEGGGSVIRTKFRRFPWQSYNKLIG